MSVDDQLRTAFGGTDDSWGLRTDEALREVTRRHRRGVVLRRGAAAGLAAAAVVAGVAFVASDGLGSDAAPDPVGPPTTPAQVEESDAPSSITVLEGRWRSGPLDEDAVRRALESSGDGRFTDDVLADLPTPPFRFVWLVTRGISQFRVVADGEATVVDDEALVIDGDQVTLTPRFDDGATVHRFALTADELRLTFVSTTEGRAAGVPGEVWQRLFYDAVTFTRD